MRYPVLIGAVTAAIAGLLWLAHFSHPRRHFNVVLISIDTLRADHLGAYGYPGRTSPFIDTVAARGAVFERVITPLPATDPSHTAMLSGLHPLVSGMLTNAMVLAPDVETIAQVFQRSGYATLGATGVYHLSARYGFARGFDVFTSVDTDGAIRRSANDVNADVLRMLHDYTAKRARQPLFLFVHYFDVHAPYAGHPDPGEYGSVPRSKAFTDELTRAYDSGIRDVDAHVGEIWRALEQAGLADDTIIAITADHGEQLGEHGFTGGHSDLYEETIRVPLVLAGPNIARARIRETASLLDLAPTLLELVGLRFSRPINGRPVAHPERGTWVPSARPLVILGYPTYVRSVGLYTNEMYFVRNLEKVYQSLAVGPIDAAVTDGASWQPAEMRASRASQVFLIPPLDFDPQQVTLDVPVRSGCSVDLTVSIPPGVAYSPHLTLTAPDRVTYSLARMDSSFVTATPAGCIDSVSWSHQRLRADATVSPEAARVASQLSSSVSTPRRDSPSDEVFDVVTDPAMTQNIIDELPVRQLDALRHTLEERFMRTFRPRNDTLTFTSDEIERLRSLGYIR